MDNDFIIDGFEPCESCREARLELRQRQLGTREPRCHLCGEEDPFALTGRHPEIVCYECMDGGANRSWVEAHHSAGRHNDDATVSVPGNDHRVLSDRQLDWPRETLRNPDGSPLLKAAAALRGWLDVLRLTLERTFVWIPPFLEWLDARLRESIGERWWVALGWEG